MIPYRLMYELGLTPWERRPVGDTWQPLVNGLTPGRALDVGSGTGRDAVHLAGRGWRVTAVDQDERALARARERAAEQGVEVDWMRADVTALGELGLEPGYDLVYDFGCLHSVPDAARPSVALGMTELAAVGGMLVLLAFGRGRRVMLPRGIDADEVLDLFGDAWELVKAQRITGRSVPPRIFRARPTLYRFVRRSA